MVAAISSAAAIPERIFDALTGASNRTGEEFDYLLKTAMRESALDPSAAAPTSSAQGLFQFVEQTWLGTVKQAGPEHGLAAYADQITQNASGRFTVSDPDTRREVLALRNDPAVAAVMAGELTAANRSELESRLGREPTDGELYIAHFLGPSGASKLISSAARTPDQRADLLFPGAAKANRSIFYSPSGTARSTQAVYHALVANHQTKGPASTVAATQQQEPVRQPSTDGQESAWSSVAGFFETLFNSLAGLFNGSPSAETSHAHRPQVEGLAGYVSNSLPSGAAGGDEARPDVIPRKGLDFWTFDRSSTAGADAPTLATARTTWLHSLFLTGGQRT